MVAVLARRNFILFTEMTFHPVLPEMTPAHSRVLLLQRTQPCPPLNSVRKHQQWSRLMLVLDPHRVPHCSVRARLMMIVHGHGLLLLWRKKAHVQRVYPVMHMSLLAREGGSADQRDPAVVAIASRLGRNIFRSDLTPTACFLVRISSLKGASRT